MQIMKYTVNKSENNISIILSIVKIGIIIFISIIMYMNLYEYWINVNIKNDGLINVYSSALFLFSTGVFYAIWVIINRKSSQSVNGTKISWLIENIVYIFLISLPAYLTNTYSNEYKYLYLLLIIFSVIQYGSRYGILTSLFSSAFILGADLICAPTVGGINIYFQKDLLITGVFVFVAWILGYYVELENENKREKEKQLKLLNSELKEQSMQRNNIEELLLKNNICFDMLFENSQTAIIVHKENEIIYANESAAKLLGYEEAAQLYKKTIDNYYPKDRIEAVNKKYLEIINNKLSKIIQEDTIVNSSGDTISVRKTSSFFAYEGQPSVLTFLLDITTEKQLEILKNDAEQNLKLLNETREFNVLITEFFTNISHEIKTPINIIYAAIQSIGLYLDNYNKENVVKCKEYLNIMKQNSFRMIRLVNNLLDTTKLDSGFMKLNKQNNNIVSVVEDITQSVATYVKSKNIELIFDTNVEEKVCAFDDDKLERIMLNLLSNAVKFTHPNGKIEVNFEDRGSEVVIIVKDEGEGIPKEKIEIVFERFGQANRSLSREHEGSGIGLYLVKAFIEMHHGKIVVNSVEGKGTEFIITLPVELLDDVDYKKANFFETKIERINIEFSDIYNIV
jgi:PAS domain S-box